MNHKEAMQRIVETHLCIWGCFFEDLPSFKDLQQECVQKILLERYREMRRMVECKEIGVFEYSRFAQEFDIICLLLVICVWGASSEDVPITEEDLGNIRCHLSSLCSAGVEEDGIGIFGITCRLLTEGLRLRQLSEPIVLSLT
ncbi:MAG: hypothetical protein WCO12_00540 [bacterium]